MKVVIDARMVTPVPHGFARYVSRIADGLSAVRESSSGKYDVAFLVSPENPIPPSLKGKFETLPVEAPFLSPAELIEIPKVLKRYGANLYHSPTFSSLVSCPCPSAITIHDLNHLTYGGLKERLYYRWVLKRFAQNSRSVMTVSQFSRDEIAPWLGLPPEQVEIVPNALDDSLFEEPTAVEMQSALHRFGLEKGRYFFCLSNPKPHKNVSFLVSCYREWRKQGNHWPLAVSVKGFEGGAGLVELGPLTDHESKALLYAAGAVVFPSLYEGFGLPPVEAVSIGVPVIASRIPAHREALQDVQADEVLWADPRDASGWTNALKTAESGGLRSPSSQTQAKVRTRYSVANMGRNVDCIYRRVLGLEL